MPANTVSAPAAAPSTVTTERFLHLQTIRIWPAAAPGAKGDTPADVPSVTVFKPHPGRSKGTAVIVAPGGGYRGLASNLEGRQVADWFAARGVTAFVLNYRLGERYPFPIALTDAQRAIRLVRANAKEWGVSPDRIGIVGFSAGGHLAAMVGTSFTPPDTNVSDRVDRVSDRPDFLILGYSAISFMEPDSSGDSKYCKFTRMRNCDPQAYARFTPDTLVRADTPPTFLYHTSDDAVVPAEDSIRFYLALRSKGIPAELHIFGTGAHGSGLGDGDRNLGAWPTLLESWLRQQGLLSIPGPPLSQVVTDDEPLSLDSRISQLIRSSRAQALLEKLLGQELEIDPTDELWRTVTAREILAFELTITDEQIQALDRSLRALPS